MMKKPEQYSKEELNDLLHKEVEIGIGDADSDEDTFTYKGKIISYDCAVDDPNLPIYFYFHTDNGSIKYYDFHALKSIRIL